MSNSSIIDLVKPQRLDQIVGQDHLIAKGQILQLAIEKKRLFPMLLFGPSGCGKSSIARVLGKELKWNFQVFNCALDNKNTLINLINLLSLEPDGKRLLIVEEIHRLNVDKQDVFLDLVENQGLIIIATTTQNPYFVLNPALRSRLQMLQLNPLTASDLLVYCQNLLAAQICKTPFEDYQINNIVNYVRGDVRALINLLDKCHTFYPNGISDANLAPLLSNHQLKLGDDNNEYHDLKSALQKSIRGSDPDAALYYLARFMTCGDYKTIARRLSICAFEDIGLANMDLCNRTIHALNLVNLVGDAEAHNILGPIVIEMALSPKSNRGSSALVSAMNYHKLHPDITIPSHLWDQHYKSATKLGATEYIYPHDFAYSYHKQSYLPEKMKDVVFYEPNPFVYHEKKWQDYWCKIKNKHNKNDK